MAMMAMKGIYAEYGVTRLNHGIGFDTAAIELLLPTYATDLGLKGKICTHWALNPHPTLIPGHRIGLRRIGALLRFGSRHGRTTSRPVPTSSSLALTAACAQTGRSARRPACTPATCSSVQPCRWTSPATVRRRRWGAHHRLRWRAEHGFRSARSAPRQRRRGSRPGARPTDPRPSAAASWSCRWSRPSANTWRRFSSKNSMPGNCKKVDGHAELPPIMIYGDDVSHIVTEEGIANLLLCRYS
jgi:malonate decarboxylase alpha subunit